MISPSNPYPKQIWKFSKKAQKTLEIGISNWEAFENMCQMKTMTDYLFQSILYLISALCCTLLLLVLCIDIWRVVILKFVFEG